jgi:ribosome-binding protein aMBF1 (putative translation factor)
MLASAKTILIAAIAIGMVQVQAIAIPRESTSISARDTDATQMSGPVVISEAEAVNRRAVVGLIVLAIKVAMKANNIVSLADLAEKSGVAEKILDALMNHDQLPGSDILHKIEAALKTRLPIKRDYVVIDRSVSEIVDRAAKPNPKLGKAVKDARVKKGFPTVQSLADKLHIAASVIDALETLGTLPGISDLASIASFLGISTNQKRDVDFEAVELAAKPNPKLGKAVKDARVKKGFPTVQSLADKLHIAASVIDALETLGTLPGISDLASIASFLGISTNQKRDVDFEVVELAAKPNPKLGKAVTDARVKKGFPTVQSLADKLHIAAQIISDLETLGKIPGLVDLTSIASFLGISTNQKRDLDFEAVELAAKPNPKLGKAVKDARVKKGFPTVQSLADKLHIAASVIDALETLGTLPGISDLASIASFLGVSTNQKRDIEVVERAAKPNPKLGKAVTDARVKKGFPTVQSLADKLHIAAQVISDLETLGKIPGLVDLTTIANFLGISTNQKRDTVLLERATKPNNPKLGKAVTDARVKKGFPTVQSLADKLHIAAQVISDLETIGKIPGLVDLTTIASFLGISTN